MKNEFKYTKNIDLFQNTAGVVISESCVQPNVINFMLDLVMVFFFFFKVKGKLTSPLLRQFMKCYLLREHLDGTVSVWWEKVLSSCLFILRFCCTREWNTQCVISTEAESTFFPQPLLPKMSYLEEKQNRKGTNLFSGSLEEHELFILRNSLLSLHEREPYY